VTSETSTSPPAFHHRETHDGGWTRRVGRLKALSSQKEQKSWAREGNFSVERTAAILFQTKLKDSTFFHFFGEGKFSGGLKKGGRKKVRVRLFSSFKQRTLLLPSAGKKHFTTNFNGCSFVIDIQSTDSKASESKVCLRSPLRTLFTLL